MFKPGDKVEYRSNVGIVTNKGTYHGSNSLTKKMTFIDVKWNDNTKQDDGGYNPKLLKLINNHD